MFKRKVFACAALASLFMTGPALAAFGTLCPKELKGWIFGKRQVHVVDVQPPESFEAHNYEGFVPARSDAELDALAVAFSRDSAPVAVVGDSGGAAEQKAAERLAAKGVAPSRLPILEGGMKAALAASSSSCDCCNPAGGKMTASAELQARLDEVGSGCVECGACVKECRFLEHYGTPKKIADSFDAGDAGSV